MSGQGAGPVITEMGVLCRTGSLLCFPGGINGKCRWNHRAVSAPAQGNGGGNKSRLCTVF